MQYIFFCHEKHSKYFLENYVFCQKCGVLRDMVPFVPLKKREKHPWRSVTFSKVPDFSLKLY